MPPKLALILCIVFVLYLLRRDSKNNPEISTAFWIPLIWFLLIGSRTVAQWLNPGVYIESPDEYLEGSAVDRAIFMSLEIAGIFILVKRRVRFMQIVSDNKMLSFFFLYAAVSIAWSDFPVVALKRYIKTIGNIIMILVVLSEADPIKSVQALLRRWSYVLIPFSVLLIKYFSELGRKYHRWTWESVYTGVTTNKNTLGLLCLISGLFFFWSLLMLLKKRNLFLHKKEIVIHIVFLYMIFWLFSIVSSATSLASLFMGIFIIMISGLSIVKRNIQYMGLYVIFAAAVFLLLQTTANITQTIIQNLGRDLTLTGRTDLWEELIDMPFNHLTGTGFESFWLGDRAAFMWDRYFWRPNQAHNGYLEIYINLGWIGLIILTIIIISTFKKIKNEFSLNFDYARLQMTLLVIILIYNMTEASFKGLDPIWFIFLLITIKYRHHAFQNKFNTELPLTQTS